MHQTTLEIEAKFKLDSHETIRIQLEELGAERAGRVMEINHIFDRDDQSLWGNGCGLRVRAYRSENGDAPAPTMTFKGPRHPGPLKQREEIEITIDDATAACTLLQRIGFVERMRFEKRRETWRLAGCLIELDEVPHLGHYVEIEGPGQDAVRCVQESVGLDRVPTIRRSYIGLLVDFCEAHGLSPIDITFESEGPHQQS